MQKGEPMSRLIDADALFRAMEETGWYNNADRDEIAEELVLKAPTIEPERKKGKWILHPEIKNIYGGTVVQCSECGEKYVVQHLEDEKYCRNCGAKMEADKTDGAS